MNDTKRRTLLSIAIPVYQGEQILDDTIARLMDLERKLPGHAQIEIVAVDDGSRDASYSKLLEISKRYPGKVRAVRLSRNFGAPAATQAGVALAKGDCVANVPQDLQEPPELFFRMFEAWQKGNKVNIGYRVSRDEPFFKKMFAGIYHALFKLLINRSYPNGGVCAFLVDRQVADELRSHPEPVEPATLLLSMGYSQCLHPYHREAPHPQASQSNWTLPKQIKLIVDNLLSFSYLPVRIMSGFGICISLASIMYAAYVLLGKVTGWYAIDQPPGWATIVVLITFLNGVVMLMLGIVGEYLWRIFDVARGRPLYLIDEDSEDQ